MGPTGQPLSRAAIWTLFLTICLFPFDSLPQGTCKRGDACPYAHGVFECWLHPCKYRTQLCKDGTSCTRRVCFFAHTLPELRAAEPEGPSTPSQPANVAPPSPSSCCSSEGRSAGTSPSDRSMLSACGSASDLSDYTSVRASVDSGDFSDALSDVSSSRDTSDDVCCSVRPAAASQYGPIGPSPTYGQCGGGAAGMQPSFGGAYSLFASDPFAAAPPSQALVSDGGANATHLSWLPFASHMVAPQLCSLAHLL